MSETIFVFLDHDTDKAETTIDLYRRATEQNPYQVFRFFRNSLRTVYYDVYYAYTYDYISESKSSSSHTMTRNRSIQHENTRTIALVE